MEYILYEYEKKITTVFMVLFIFLMFILIINLFKIRKKSNNNIIKYLGIIVSFTIIIAGIIIQFLPIKPAMLLSTLIIYFVLIFIALFFKIIKSGRAEAQFNKDYIIILGCRLNKEDGTVADLLKKRIDRAISFANEQYCKTGKKITFVTSGGQGKDEVISEGEAIKKYLIQKGIRENDILVEDKSASTYENFKLSLELIQEQAKNSDVCIVYSTSDYHVYRIGKIAKKLGIKVEGIGAKTVFYYWINCTIREIMILIFNNKLLNILGYVILLLITWMLEYIYVHI